MKLTRQTDYSLRVLIFLALQEEGRLVTISEITEHFDIPRNHLVKIVHRLGQLKYLKTLRGKGGGMCLGHGAADIVIGRVVRDVESTLEVVNCHEPPCPLEVGCVLKGALVEARDAFLAVLDRYTLADLIVRPQQLQALLHWHPPQSTV